MRGTGGAYGEFLQQLWISFGWQQHLLPAVRSTATGRNGGRSAANCPLCASAAGGPECTSARQFSRKNHSGNRWLPYVGWRRRRGSSVLCGTQSEAGGGREGGQLWRRSSIHAVVIELFFGQPAASSQDL